MATPTSQPVDQQLFVRKASGLIKGWSSIDGFRYAFFSVNLFLGIFGFTYASWFAGGSLFWSIIITTVVVMAGVLVYAGLIAAMPARRRRLRVADAYLQQPHRLHPGGLRLVVHPLAVDPHLRQPDGRLFRQSCGPHHRLERSGRLAGHQERHLRLVAGGHCGRLATRGRGHEGLCQVPDLGPDHRHGRLCGHADHPGGHQQARVPERLRPRVPQALRRQGRLRCHCQGGRRRPGKQHLRRLALAIDEARALHVLLAAVAELGRHPLRRGPGRKGLP